MAASFSGFPFDGNPGIKNAFGYVLYSNEEGRRLVMGNFQKTLYLKG
jgi:hypothetical protein